MTDKKQESIKLNENRSNNDKDNDEQSKKSFKDTIKVLKNKINDIQKNIKDIKIREQAEIENINKNSKNKIIQIQEFQLETFCRNLIPIIENFKTIEKNAYQLKSQYKSLIQGIFLILNSLMKTTQQFGLNPITSKPGEIFNSLLHTIQSNEKLPKNIKKIYINSIIKQGYFLNKKIIKKSIVTISKSSENTTKTN